MTFIVQMNRLRKKLNPGAVRATTGTVSFPVCADCARCVEERLLNILLLEMSLMAHDERWESHFELSAHQQDRDQIYSDIDDEERTQAPLS